MGSSRYCCRNYDEARMSSEVVVLLGASSGLIGSENCLQNGAVGKGTKQT